LWERILLVPFETAFVDREPTASNERRADPALFEKLKAEYSGILGWMVRGCLEFQEKGLNPPEAVRMATQEYRAENDILASFIDECCSLDGDFETTAKDLYAAYKEWAEINGYRPLNVTNFGKKLKDKFDSYKSRKGIMYIGICVNGCE
jgi:putative DNA primase/helicase